MTEKERTPKEKRLLKVIAILKKVSDRDFFGKMIVSFEAGKAVNVNVQESHKIEE